MSEELNVGCKRPEIKKVKSEQASKDINTIQREEEKKMTMIKVGKPAPDFTAPAFIDGKFSSVKLSDYKGQWISLCFYPGDFTFV